MSDPRKPNGDDRSDDADDGERQDGGARESDRDAPPSADTASESGRGPTDEPDAHQPEAQEPEAQEPEAQESEAHEPEAQESEAQESEAHEADAGEPEEAASPGHEAAVAAHSDEPERPSEPGAGAAGPDEQSAEGTAHGETDRPADDDGEAPPPTVAGSAPESGASTGGAAADGGGPGGRGPHRAHWGWYVLVLLVLAAIVGGTLGGRWIVQRFERIEGRLAEVRTAREEALAPLARSSEVSQAIESAREELQGRLEALGKERSAAADDMREALESRIADVEEAIATVRELAGRRQLEWRLAEVDYLLGVAARRLAIANDRRSAIAALEAADRSLAAIGDVRLVDLRRAIVDDVSALRETQPADVEGIALRIQALLERLPELPEAGAGAPSRAEASGSGGASGSWWERLRDRLSRYVVVRRKGEPGAERERVEVALPAREKLRLALSEARRAALRHSPDPYAAAMDRARGVLDRGFEAGAPLTERFANTLAELADRPVTTQYPDVTETLEQARRVAARLRAEADRIERTRAADPAATSAGGAAADGGAAKPDAASDAPSGDEGAAGAADDSEAPASDDEADAGGAEATGDGQTTGG